VVRAVRAAAARERSAPRVRLLRLRLVRAARDAGGVTLGAAGDGEGRSGEEEGREEGEGDHNDCEEGYCSLAIGGRLEASFLEDGQLPARMGE
jgi:hypothetical protein